MAADADDTYLSIVTLPTLPATSDNFLVAGWVGALTEGDAFPAIEDVGVAGINVVITAKPGGTQFDVSGFNNVGASIFDLSILIGSFFQSNDFHSYAISADTTTQLVQLLVDTNLTVVASTSPDIVWHGTQPISFFPTSDGWQIGPVADDGSVSLSDFYFEAGAGFFNLAVQANALKIFSAQNTPVPWGSQGENITGQVPAVYLHGFGAEYPFNLGSGGPFTVHGMLTSFSPELCVGAIPGGAAPEVVWTDMIGNVLVDVSGNVQVAP